MSKTIKEILEIAGLMNESTCQLLARHEDYSNLTRIISILFEAQILTFEIFVVVVAHPKPVYLASGLSILNDVGILNFNNFSSIVKYECPELLASGYYYLHKAALLTFENQTILNENANQQNIFTALSRLLRAGILTQQNFVEVVKHSNPFNLARLFCNLHLAGLLTIDNRIIIADHKNSSGLVLAISFLQNAGILTQENLNLILNPIYKALLTENARDAIWNRMPINLLTQNNFDRLLTGALELNPEEVLRHVTNQIIGEEAVLVREEGFNRLQSTHTVSVHRSVSLTARKLMAVYGCDLQLYKRMIEIKAYVNSLDDSLKAAAAKRCIERISAREFSFTDISGVSLLQLLALVWLAIHDDSKRQGCLDDAKYFFIDGLYEIQRGYNLNKAGVDNQGPDASICVAGTFNKLIEKLNGIHKDVEIYYITHEGASYKFPKLIQKQALMYLRRLASPKTAVEYLQVNTILKEKVMDAIWEKIKSQVEAAMWDEFKEAYANNREHHLFREMIENGNYIEFPDLTEIENQLVQSAGYKDFLYECEKTSLAEGHIILYLHQHSLWSNRHAGANEQHAFDFKYGLKVI